MQALAHACAASSFPASATVVLSNDPNAKGLDFAKDVGIATEVVNHKNFDGREPFEDALDAAIRPYQPDLICLAGFMRILTPSFINRWPDKIINIHPSMLPAYRGLNTHERVLADGVRFTGCTVHYVRPEMDNGPIIAQAAIPTRQGEDSDALAARVLTYEHRIYPMAVKLVAEGRVEIVDEVTRIDGEPAIIDGVINPSFES